MLNAKCIFLVLVFLYKLVPGLAHRSYGLNVAKLAKLPLEVLKIAQSKAAELESLVEKRRLTQRR